MPTAREPIQPGIGRHPAHRTTVRVECYHGSEIRLVVQCRTVEREQAMTKIATTGASHHPHTAHPEHVVDIGGGRTQVTDPASRTRLGVEADDEGGCLLA